MPFFAANSPFGKCTLAAATIMTETISAGPIGPRRPSATRTPLANSVAAATVANILPGRKPRCSNIPPVAARPCPPNQPKSFWEPWAAMSSPRTMRATSKPMAAVVTSMAVVGMRVPEIEWYNNACYNM
jgi:hypothetical protein